MLKTILFDLDGVIVDSEPIHAKAKQKTLDEFGINYNAEIINQFKGQTDESFFKAIIKSDENFTYDFKILLERKQGVFLEILPELKLVDGFKAFIEKVKANNIRTALVSSTSIFSLELMNKHFGITPYFELIITEEDTQLHKPDPAPYLKALNKLNENAQDVLVIEDSPNGIKSAVSAGCKVYALTTTFKPDELNNANKIFNGYHELENFIFNLKTNNYEKQKSYFA